jgi:hypothetical protein
MVNVTLRTMAEDERGGPMRLLIVGLAGLAMALTTTSAPAQVPSPQQAALNSNSQLGQHAGNALAAKPEDQTKVKANEKAYNAALRNLPDKQYDPWHGVR